MAAIVCKRRGDNYEMKDILDLNNFKVTNNPTTDKEGKKVSGDTCKLSVFLFFCFFFDFEHRTFFISSQLRQSAEMPFSEMSASDFIAVISMCNKSRTALLRLAAVQGQLSLHFVTRRSW